MPELDRFEARLTGAVHAFADRAETAVDAVAVAERSIRPRRSGAFAWLWRPLPVSASLLLLTGLLLALFGWMLGTGGPWNRALPAPTLAPTASPSPTPASSLEPATDGVGDEHIVGSLAMDVVTACSHAGSPVCIGGRASVAATANDPRATGRGTWTFQIDDAGATGAVSGRLLLETTLDGRSDAQGNPVTGSWDGACTGAAWRGLDVEGVADGVEAEAFDCWLAGSGAFDGYTFFLSATRESAAGAPYRVEGIVYPGSTPVTPGGSR